ncbi:MAG TPA: hypothetical protein VKN73_13825 [Desulfosalsimonadaceae bacterium]|nr:hypothetical protein [Desulfosalsimonadaceae bacterium]
MASIQTKTGINILLAIFLICGLCATSHAEQKAVIATVSPDYESGAHAVASVDPLGGPRDIQTNLAPTGSDITVTAFGEYFYRIEGSGAHSISKFHVNSPAELIWQYSTEGREENSFPHDLVFVDSEKAYLLRYGSDTAWIVNPSAETEDAFKTGELDLSAYADTDGVPEMHSGVVVGDRLFITLQRVDYSGGFSDVEYYTPYVAVFDTTTNEEIDVLDCGCEMKGIEIPEITNLGAIQYLDVTDRIYVQGMGDYDQTEGAPMGGILSIDPDTYETNVLLTDDFSFYGAVTGMVVVSETKGYFIGYAGWGDNTLYTFDPSCDTGCGIGAVPGFENISIAGMESGVYTDENGMAWICVQSPENPRVDILNPTDDTIDESLATELNPLKVAFTESDSAGNGNGDNDDADGGGGGSSSSGCFIGVLK